MENQTIIQFFHWYYPADKGLWKHAASEAERLAHLGFTKVWLPPPYKCDSGADISAVGYGVYDLYDLGEFDQKGTRKTKYGSKDEFVNAIKRIQEMGMDAIVDIVLNHKTGGDDVETFKAVQVNNDNRNEKAGEETDIEAFTKFYFPGRNGTFSNFIWDKECFTGIDKNDEQGCRIYKILNNQGDTWQDVPDEEFGNFDFLLGCDIDYRNEYVRTEIKNWAKWLFELTGFHGCRMDAVKHISTSFMNEFLDYIKTLNEHNFSIGEYWTHNVDKLLHYIELTEGRMQLIDSPLHYNFHRASNTGKDFDLRTLSHDTLLDRNPLYSISFVDNHDTQPLQALESTVEDWFKPLAYAYIMLRKDGIPCISFFAMYGATYSAYDKDGNEHYIELKPTPDLDKFLHLRKNIAYGEQHDYFDHGNTIGWTREGNEEHGHGMAVIMSNGDEGFKEMYVGQHHAGKTFVDYLNNKEDRITINENGLAVFPVHGGSVSVYIPEECPHC